MDDFGAFNTVYENYFVSKPARSCFAVKELPKMAQCEIEAIAMLNNDTVNCSQPEDDYLVKF